MKRWRKCVSGYYNVNRRDCINASSYYLVVCDMGKGCREGV